MNSRHETLVFLHIPKTAGSTFHRLLNSRYKKREIYNVFGARYADPKIVHFMGLREENKANIRLLKGHMPFGLHNYMPTKCCYISVLRNPVERVISQYYYIKNNAHNPLHKKVEEGGISIEDFVSSGISIGMNNGQCRFLNGDIETYPFNSTDEALFSQAISNIENHFLWLGVTDRFDESVLVLAKLLGWKKYPYYIRENVSKTRKNRTNIAQVDVDAIKKYNQFDLRIYKFANDWLDAEIGKIENFAETLESFKIKNNQIQQRWQWLPGKLKGLVV